jgi:hypothetical protein
MEFGQTRRSRSERGPKAVVTVELRRGRWRKESRMVVLQEAGRASRFVEVANPVFDRMTQKLPSGWRASAQATATPGGLSNLASSRYPHVQ